MLSLVARILREHRSLVANFISLILLQGTNFLLPLVVAPYLLRVVGVEKFGAINYAQAVMNYFIVITDYGFGLSATREIAIHRDDPARTARTFRGVMTAKAILCGLCLLVLGALVLMVPGLRREWLLYTFSAGTILGQAFGMNWLFQGMEQMRYMAILNFISKMLFLALTFTLVRRPDDYIYVNAFMGVGSLVGTLVSLCLAYNAFGLSVRLSSGAEVLAQLREGWHVFVSNFTTALSLSSNLIILGFFANSREVGYYSIAEKAFLAMRTVAIVLYTAIYPKVCALAQGSFDELLRFLRGVVRIVLLGFVPLGALAFLSADYIVMFLSGKPIPTSATVLRVLAFAPLLAALSIPACHTMLAFDLRSSYMRISMGGAVLNVVLNLFLARAFGAVGSALAAALTEVYSITVLFLFLRLFHPRYSTLRALRFWS